MKNIWVDPVLSHEQKTANDREFLKIPFDKDKCFLVSNARLLGIPLCLFCNHFVVTEFYNSLEKV